MTTTRIYKVILTIGFVICFFTGCLMEERPEYKTNITTDTQDSDFEQHQNEDISKTIEDNSGDVYEKDKLLTTTNYIHPINFGVESDTLNIFGSLENDDHKYCAIVLNQTEKEMFPVVNGIVDCSVNLPDKEKEALVEIYVGASRYGNYKSIILDYVILKHNNGRWYFEKSPVYDNNNMIFSKLSSSSEYLAPSERIQSENSDIAELAQSITQSIDGDYMKAKAIHDWVSSNIHYDFDSLRIGSYENMDALSVYATKKGVCEGYANLTAALLRSLKIPCTVRGGYALGIDTNKKWSEKIINGTETNHAWKEVFVDNRWIIVDSTWDSQNKYENGNYTKGEFITDVYFDSTLEYFSLSHKLME